MGPILLVAVLHAALLAPVEDASDAWETRYKLGLSLLESRRFEEAARELRIAARQKPELSAVRLALGTALMKTGDLAAATAEFEQVLRSEPRSAAALHQLAQIRILEENYSSAAQFLSRAAEIEPRNPQHALALSVAYTENAELEKAAGVLNALIASHPGLAAAHCQLGIAYARQQNAGDAVRSFRECLRLDPSNGFARLSLAKSLVSAHQYEEALIHAQQVAPDGFETHYVRGLCLRQLGRYAQARAQLDRAVALNPAHADAAFNLGIVLAQLNDLEGAARHLEDARSLNPANTAIRFQLATVLRDLGRESRAKEEFREIRRLTQQRRRSEVAGTSAARANRMLLDGDAQAALEVYGEALKLDPGNARIYFNMALAFAKCGDVRRQQEALETAIRIDGRFAEAHHELGKLYVAAGKLDLAEPEFSAAIAARPSFPEARNSLGVLYGRLNRNTEAEKLFRQALEQNPADVIAHLNLGLILAAQGRLPEARVAAEKALAISPGDARAREVLDRIRAAAGRAK